MQTIYLTNQIRGLVCDDRYERQVLNLYGIILELYRQLAYLSPVERYGGQTLRCCVWSLGLNPE